MVRGGGLLAVVSAEGIHVRHALTRALSTHNRTLSDATFRVLSARVTLDARGRVAQASVSLRIEVARERGAPDVAGLVNPYGAHPLMAAVPGLPGVLLDVLPVTGERWARSRPGDPTPAGRDPWCPRVGVSWDAADTWARAMGKRLPRAAELSAAWGPRALPWGDTRDPRLGLDAPPRFGELPEVGVYPPNPEGFFDLGMWLAQWTTEGDRIGLAPGAAPGPEGEAGVGLRCAVEL